MKKLILMITLYFSLVGFTYSDNSPYLLVNCSLGNNVRIYFAKNDLEYLEVSDYEVINQKNTTIYGYSGNTQLYFPTYDNAYYRTNYNNINLSISRVLENHLYPTTSMVVNKNFNLYTIALIGGLLVWSVFNNKRL